MQKPSIKKIAIAILAVLLLAAGYFFFLQKPETAAADWWDDSWLFRQIISVSNSGSAQTDFQVQLTVDTAALYTAGKIQIDCDDIRLTDLNGKLLDYWLEPTTCNTSATKIWTKIPSIPATTGASIYLYYGNSAVISASSTANTFICEISGVQGAWNMNGTGAIATGATLADSSGNTNTGTASNVNTTGMAYASSQFEQGVDFDGVDDSVSAPIPYDFSANLEGSYSFWFKSSATSPAVAEVIFLPTIRLDVNIEATTGKIFVWFTDSNNAGHLVWKSGTNNLYIDGNWHFFTVSKNSTRINVYIDTTNVGGWNTTLKTYSNTANLRIGFSGTSYHFTGSLDEVRIYNYALSQSEITDLYGTGGDRQGYVTTNYPNKSLVRKYSANVSAGAPSGEERGPGPVAFWKFDEGFGTGAQDSTINNNDGVISGATWQSEDMCVTGKCLRFDGTDDYVNAGNGAGLNITGNITIASWIKTTASAYKFIVSKHYSATTGSYFLTAQTGGIQMTVINTNPVRVDCLKTFNYYDGNWHFVAGVYDGSKITVYVDGNNLGSCDQSGSILTSGFPVYIGHYSTLNPGYAFNGSIDDVKIYPYARTAAQIKTDYASRGSSNGSSVVIASEAKQSLSNGLVGFWKMDEASWNGTAGEVLDASGAGNNGVAAGATHKPTTGAGKFGNGGVFDGVDDYVNAGNGASLNILNNKTISVWVKATTGAGNRGILNTRGGGSVGYVMRLDPSLDIFNTGITANGIMNINYAPYFNVWTNIVWIQSSTTGHSVFINGVSIASDPSLTNGLTSANNLYIGAENGIAGFFNGSIDSVRIYNRALSPKEVRDLYNFAPGPVGWWKMDEKVSGNAKTLNDSSGYGNTGTTSSANGTGMDCMVQGKIGGGCEFDGVDDYVNAGNGASLNITNAITMEAWVNPTLSTVGHIVGKGINAVSGYWLFYNGGDTGWRARFQTNSQIALVSSAPSPRNTWTHLTATYDTVNGGKFYVNGLLQQSLAANGSIISTTLNCLIGAHRDATWYKFSGIIDDVRIYNYARTPSQIAEDYAGGAGRKQPVGYWKFDEGYGITANNSGIGGSALNGTLTTMASPATATSGWTDSGKMGKALVFDGGNDFVDAGSDASLNISSSYSTMAWVKPTIGVDSGIVSKDGVGDNRGRYLVMMANGTIRSLVSSDGTLITYFTTTKVVSSSVWQHVATVYNASTQTLRIYINGVNEAGTLTGTIPSSINICTISNRIGSRSGSYFSGSIDEVKIYNFALTEDEVREEYNSGALLKLGSTGTTSAGAPDNSANREYCIPGDTSTCNPPVGYWNFDEGTGATVNDITGNANTGTWSGTGSRWTPGKIGWGGSFNGSNDYVGVGAAITPQNFTISFWANRTKPGLSDTGFFGSSGYTQKKGIGVYGVTDTHNLWLGNGTANTIFIICEVAERNQYVFLTITKDGNNINTYKNGVLKTSHVYADAIDYSGTTFNIGNGLSTAYSHTGTLDDVRIYNYARTPAQVAWDYNRGKPIAHWRFNECQGATAYDSSGNGNNGTITIGATVPQTALGTCAGVNTANAWYNGATGKINSSMSFDGVDDYAQATVTQTKTAYALWVKNGSVWEHVVNNNGTYYVNGIAGATPTSYPIYVSGTTVQIGKSADAVFVDCDVDDVKIFNYALTAEQIKTEYNGGAVNFR